MARAAGHARLSHQLSPQRYSLVSRRWHGGLVLGRVRTLRYPGHDLRAIRCGKDRRDRRAPSRPARDRRPHGTQRAVEGQRFGARRRCAAQVRPPSERRGESLLPALLRRRTLPISNASTADSPRRRNIRSASSFLGHRSFATALQLPPSSHTVYSRARFFFGPGQGVDHGSISQRLAALAAARAGLRKEMHEARAVELAPAVGNSHLPKASACLRCCSSRIDGPKTLSKYFSFTNWSIRPLSIILEKSTPLRS